MSYILPKKLVICVVFVVGLLIFKQPVAAQSSDVVMNIASIVNIHSDGSGDVTYSLVIKNGSKDLVKNISLPVLIESITGVEVKLGGSPVYYATEQSGEFTLINTDLQLAAIRPGSEATVEIKIQSSRFIQAKYGIYEFLQPRIESDFLINSYTLDLNYPVDAFPPLAYTSALDKDPQPNKVLMDSKSGFWLVWGNDAIIDLSGTVQVNNSAPTLVNLVPRLPHQEVVHKQIDKLNGLVQDNYSNLWAVVNPLQFKSPSYQTRVHKLPVREYPLSSVSYPKILPPQIVESLLDTRAVDEVVDLIYTYLVDTYQPDMEPTGKAAELGLALPSNERKLLPLEYVYYMAGMLENVGVHTNIVYGFQFSRFKSFNNYNLTLPQVWLEVPGDEVQIYDPYFQEVTGWRGTDVPHVNRVTYGTWDPENDHDSVLGLLQGAPTNNPQPAELGEITNDFKIEVGVSFPETVLSGNYYEGKLTITNKSAIPLVIESIQLDDQDLSDRLLVVGDNYRLVARPNGITEITIPQYMNLDVLGAYTKTGRITVKVRSDALTPQVVRYQVEFVPNYGLTAAIVVSTLAVGGFLLIFLFRRQVLIKLMKRRYYK